MTGLATRRLIDAAAKLNPADRALLNLWVNRGLDDERLTELTGLSIDALHVRREKIVAQLAAELGLPDEDVREALEQISPDDEALGPPGPHGVTGAAPSPNGAMTVTEPEAPPPDAEPPPPAPDLPPAPPAGLPEASRSQRWLWLGLLALVVIAAVVIAIVASGRRSPPAPRPTARTPSTATTATQTPTLPTPAHPTANPVPAPLAGLPGGLAHASGSVKLSGKLKNLKLNLRVRGLPAADAGHYEVWLYNTVIDSRPLGRLRNGHHRLTVHLPANARHYRWIDISFQPVGAVNHSGESELRASNPAHTTMARLRKHSSRTRHRLRQATKVSAAHPARPPKRHRGQGSRPARTRAGGHRLKRSARGSSRAKTSK
ncbi:MAG TPA: hypothetical protein VHW04_01025 [Solirubrobacteraceae bacterium]|nr:hypothetical protein [Solirubrobacteraceae bacterium]